jgi:hypothetical protein
MGEWTNGRMLPRINGSGRSPSGFAAGETL